MHIEVLHIPHRRLWDWYLFVLQEKKTKMIFLKDGSAATGGFAPYASRFNNGGYIHGVPTNAPATGIIEYSYMIVSVKIIVLVSSHPELLLGVLSRKNL